MTNPHDKALQAAANELLAHGEFGTFEEANRRNAVSAAGAAISAYLSSIDGVVCAREPAGYVTEVELAQLKFGVSCVDLFGTVAFKDFKLVPLHAPIPEAGNGGDGWLPIGRADKSIDRILDFAGMPRPIGNSEEYWVRDADGRVYQATWADDGHRAYWWDLEGESPVDPVEFMPHPLDRRFSSTHSNEGREKA